MAGRTAARRTRQAAQGHMVIGGYTRLSVDRNGNKIGYEIQRAAIERWAGAYGYTVVWYQDKDITAADKDIVRPEYERMLADLQTGTIIGVIVWRLDRLVRLTREFERCFAIVEDAGGFIVDVDQEFTTKTATGKLIMRLLVILAEMEIASMKTRQLAHQRQKAKDGKHHGGGQRAFGFVGAVRNEKGEIINSGDIGVRHVKAEADLLREAARRIAHEGERISEVVRDWSQRTPPVVGTRGKPFTVGTLGELLTSHRVAGYRITEEYDEKSERWTITQHDAVWEPIIDRPTWTRLCNMRQRRENGPQPAAYLLGGGLATCGRCDGALVGAQRPVYQRKGASEPQQVKEKSYKCNKCYRTNVKASDVELIAIARLFTRIAESPEVLDQAATADDGVNAELTAAYAEIDECRDELVILAQRRHLPHDHDDRLEEFEYAASRAEVRARWQEAKQRATRLAQSVSFPTPVGTERDDLHAWFERQTDGQRQAFLRAHISRIRIDPPSVRGRRYFDSTRVRLSYADAQQSGRLSNEGGVGDASRQALFG
jgi:DNA invertase Pin-like site-specific DNA recombinase